MKLLIAEKPSVARDIARVVGARTRGDGYLEGGGYRVSWCVGHLLELCEPHEYDAAWKRWSAATLPILPDKFRTRPRKGGYKQLTILRRLLRARDVTRIINACDAGREGELIFRLVYEHSLGRQDRRPVDRLWISSLTDQAIREGLARLRPSAAFDRLADAARSRSEADWLVGLNATRALTILARKAGGAADLMSVGRVQTPTLALLVRREDAIEAFVSELFWTVHARFQPPDPLAPYPGAWQRPRKDKEAEGKSSRLKDPLEAQAIVDAVRGRRGVVRAVERKEVRERPPLLFDLTTLQKTANRRFGLSAQQTLTTAQALYERHKCITYPRTAARFLPSDMRAQLPSIVAKLQTAPWTPAAAEVLRLGAKATGRMINDRGVTDHHAIIPTGVLPRSASPVEQRVFDLIVRRFLAAFLPPAVFAKTRIETQVGEHRFVSEGRVRLAPGWHLAEPPPRPKRTKDGRDPTLELPAVVPGMPVDTVAATSREGETKPPKRYSEAALLAAMETCGKEVEEAELRRALRESGLGTPATRAAIIETLLRRDYVRRDRKQLVATARGRSLIGALPVEALKSAELTGRWEARLTAMADGGSDGGADRRGFMAEIRQQTRSAVAAILGADTTQLAETMRAVGTEVLGRCPVCGGEVSERRKAYSCSSGRECSFVIFKTVAGRKISPALVQVLLTRKRSQVLRGFRSRKKKGRKFAARLVLGQDGTVSFEFDDTRSSSPAKPKGKHHARGSTPAKPRPSGPRCRACGKGHVITGRRGWGCSRWREGCTFVVWFEQSGFRIPDDEAERLFRRGQTRLMDGLVDGGRARFVLDLEHENNVRVERSKRGRSR